jgi:hypothetical protein
MAAQLFGLTQQAERVDHQRQALLKIFQYLDELSPDETVTSIPPAFESSPVVAAPHLDQHAVQEEAAEASMTGTSISQSLLDLQQTMQTAHRHRIEALKLLRAADGATDTSRLNTLDRRLAATSQALEAMTKDRG